MHKITECKDSNTHNKSNATKPTVMIHYLQCASRITQRHLMNLNEQITLACCLIMR